MPGSLPATIKGPIVLVVNKADGDEEVWMLFITLYDLVFCTDRAFQCCSNVDLKFYG